MSLSSPDSSSGRVAERAALTEGRWRQNRDDRSNLPLFARCHKESFALLITGCGFSGTGLSARVFTEAFSVRLGHERFDVDGASSWKWQFKIIQATASHPQDVGAVAYTPSSFCSVVAQVRNPLGVVASGLAVRDLVNGGATTSNVVNILPHFSRGLDPQALPVTCRLLLWWLVYTEHARSLPNYVVTFRVDKDTYAALGHQLGLPCDDECERTIERVTNVRVNPHGSERFPLTWANVTEKCPCSEWYVRAALRLASSLGYDEVHGVCEGHIEDW